MPLLGLKLLSLRSCYLLTHLFNRRFRFNQLIQPLVILCQQLAVFSFYLIQSINNISVFFFKDELTGLCIWGRPYNGGQALVLSGTLTEMLLLEVYVVTKLLQLM